MIMCKLYRERATVASFLLVKYWLRQNTIRLIICLSLKLIILDVLVLIFELSSIFAVMNALSLERGPGEVLKGPTILGPTGQSLLR